MLSGRRAHGAACSRGSVRSRQRALGAACARGRVRSEQRALEAACSRGSMLSVSRPLGQSAFRATCSRSGGLSGHLLSCLLLSGHLLSEQRALEVACPRCGGLAGCAFLAACSQGTVFSGLRFISRQRAHGAACFRCSVFGAACSWGSVLSERRALGAAPALGAACCQRRVLAVPRAVGAPRRWIAAVDSATGCGRVGFSFSVAPSLSVRQACPSGYSLPH